MTAVDATQAKGAPGCEREGAEAVLDLAEWLRLAATPTFAILALLTGLGGSPMDRLCAAGHAAPLSGMVTMYLLMSTFHAPPWLNMVRGTPAPRGPR